MFQSSLCVVPDLIFVRVDQIDVRPHRRLRRFIQRVRSDQVVMIHEADEFSRCLIDRSIRIRRDGLIFRKIDHPQPAVAPSVLLQDLGHLLIFGAGVCDHQLQIRIRLTQNAVKKSRQIDPGRLPGRHHNGEQRCFSHRQGRAFTPLPVQFFLRGSVFLIPRPVGNLVRCQPFAHTNQEVLRSVVFQVPQCLPDIVGFHFLKERSAHLISIPDSSGHSLPPAPPAPLPDCRTAEDASGARTPSSCRHPRP